MLSIKLTFISIFLAFYLPSISANTFRLASYYQDHMVLQRAPLKARIWGYAEDGATISVTFKTNTYNASPSIRDGVWSVLFEPVVSDNVPVDITITQKTRSGVLSTIKLSDVLFGDVWLCGGQSNMDMALTQDIKGQTEIQAASAFANVRIFKVAYQNSNVPLNDINGISIKWSAPTQFTVPWFSATCWYFGKDLNKKLNVPIGMIHSSVGGTEIEKWMPNDAFAFNTPRKPNSDSTLWNAMINPFIGLSIYGAIWYQGESNAWYNADWYKLNFPKMINNWRNKWFVATEGATNPNFPFGFVQIANYDPETQSIGAFPWLRFHQTADFGYSPNPLLDNVFMASAVDLVDNTLDAIHPRFKEDVGQRLSLGALNLAYGQQVEFSAPRVLKVSSSTSTINIDFVSNPLQFKPVKFRQNGDRGFEVCCDRTDCKLNENSNWQLLTGININEDAASGTATISFPKPLTCNSPMFVRYLWRQKPCEFKDCPLYSLSSNLPVTPFIYEIVK